MRGLWLWLVPALVSWPFANFGQTPNSQTLPGDGGAGTQVGSGADSGDVAALISAGPASSTNSYGSSVTLSVSVSGTLPVTYQWRYNGMDLPGATNATLEIKNVRAHNAGEYSVWVRGSAGGVLSTKAVLTVIQPPMIVTQPQSQTNALGAPVAFEVRATGDKPLFYQWQHHGLGIDGATSDSLMITEAAAGDAGDYQVVVSNRFGVMTSMPALLTVLAPPKIIRQSESQTVPANFTVVLLVVAAGDPPLSYQWKLNGQNILGETNDTLVLTNVQPQNSGLYQALAANPVGVAESAILRLAVNRQSLPFADNFVDRGRLNVNGSLTNGGGNNVMATREPGEPEHAGRPGGKSLWLSWLPSQGGIMTLSTLGSTFDTLLAVYTGNSVSNLTLVADDDDSGNFFAGQVRFRAEPGIEYQIAVDGVAGGAGDLLLSWNFEPTPDTLPKLKQQPQSRTVRPGEATVLSVEAESPEALGYQWFFNGKAIPDATNAIYQIPSATRDKVGRYSVAVIGRSSLRQVQSLAASVELHEGGDPLLAPYVLMRDKLSDDPSGQTGIPIPLPIVKMDVRPRRRPMQGGGPEQGTTGIHYFSTFGATKDEDEPDHCGEAGGASEWYPPITFPTNGTLLASTEGSDFDTVLAVYEGPQFALFYQQLTAVACDNNSGADGRTSRLTFPAQAGKFYHVVVDGVGGVSGNVMLSLAFGSPPTITQQPTNRTVIVGRPLALSVAATADPPPQFQWRYEGEGLPGFTNATLTLTNILPTQGGEYGVVVSNQIGAVISDEAWVSVTPPEPLVCTRWEFTGAGQFKLQLTGAAEPSYVLQSSTNLTEWFPVLTNAPCNGVLDFTDSPASSVSWRFYRALRGP